jgi:hypothetical protein
MKSSGRKNYLRSLFSSPNHTEVCCIYAKYVEFLDSRESAHQIVPFLKPRFESITVICPNR